MVEWTDEGVILGVRPHGEGSGVLTLMTREHGRHAGLARGVFSAKARGQYQPGNRVSATWRARLNDHLGNYTCEPTRDHAAALLDEPLKLAALTSACAVAETALPEREPHEGVHDGLVALLEMMEMPEIGDAWVAGYVQWELGMLSELGYGLDLATCAATGTNDDLAYVSPRTGRAVSLSAGEPYRDKLLAMPRFLLGGAGGMGAGDPEDLFRGLALTGFFLERNVFATHHRPPPAARNRFVERFARETTVSGGGPSA